MLFYLRDEPRSTLASLCEAYREVRESAALANREALAAGRLSTSCAHPFHVLPCTMLLLVGMMVT